MITREMRSAEDLEIAYAILHELRKELSRPDFLRLEAAARKADDYRLIGAFDGGTCVAVMGCRVLHDFVHGRHLYIDDLVVSESQRSKGWGAKLLKYAEDVARAHECQSMRLSTGVDNVGAKRFYEREGWALRSVTYKVRLTS